MEMLVSQLALLLARLGVGVPLAGETLPACLICGLAGNSSLSLPPLLAGAAAAFGAAAAAVAGAFGSGASGPAPKTGAADDDNPLHLIGKAMHFAHMGEAGAMFGIVGGAHIIAGAIVIVTGGGVVPWLVGAGLIFVGVVVLNEGVRFVRREVQH